MTHIGSAWQASHQLIAGLAFIFGSAVAFALREGAMRGDRKSQFGNASFATTRDIRRAGLYAEKGIVVGRHNRRLLMFAGQEFVLVAAPTRSGKGVGIVVPNLLMFDGSVVVLDIKGENFARTAQFRRNHGQRVFRFAPFSGDSAKYNPLANLSDEPDRRFGEVMSLAGALYPPTREFTFWNEQAANLFVGLVLYLYETPGQPRTMNQLLRVAAGSPGTEIRRSILKLVQSRALAGMPLSEPCSGALARFAANSEAAAAGVLSSFNAPLLVFGDPLVASATGTSDFCFADLRRQRTSIYVCVDPQHISAARVILNLFFTQLIFQNTNHLPASPRKQNISCLMVMDEFTSIGRLDILAHSIAFMAGYDLRLLTIVQSVAQLIGVYGESDARVLLANHALRVVFAPNELRDAREISETLGTTTLRSRHLSESRVRGFGGRHTATYRHGENSRPLLLPQELRNLGRDMEVILLSGAKPILAKKIRYFDDPVLRKRSAA